MPRFYAEERRFDSKPKVVIYEQEPPTRTSEGAKKRFIVKPIEMNIGHADMTLRQVVRYYGPNAIFRNC